MDVIRMEREMTDSGIGNAPDGGADRADELVQLKKCAGAAAYGQFSTAQPNLFTGQADRYRIDVGLRFQS
jgi:hypothetical protein